jgi:hypothetical protein
MDGKPHGITSRVRTLQRAALTENCVGRHGNAGSVVDTLHGRRGLPDSRAPRNFSIPNSCAGAYPSGVAHLPGPFDSSIGEKGSE